MTDTVVRNQQKRQKRKKNNSRFLRNAKGFAKQGIYGRGTHINDDQYNYFIQILDVMKQDFMDFEEKVTLANNVFEQTKGQEIHLSSNQIVCKVLESLVGYIDAENLERCFAAFSVNFRPICSDRFSSHVLQKMVEVAFLRAVGKNSAKTMDEAAPTVAKRAKVDVLSVETYCLETEFPAEHKENCKHFVERVSKFLLNNLEDFVWDSCANHIMRTCILSLAGVHVAKLAFEKGGADIAKQQKLYTVPAEWAEVMKEFPHRLEMWPQFTDFPYQEHSSALLGVICIALKVVDKNMLKHFGKKILMEAFLKVDCDGDEKNKKDIMDSDERDEAETHAKNSRATAAKTEDKTQIEKKTKLPKVFEYLSAVMLLETLITVAGPKLLIQLFAMLFVGRAPLLAKEQLTNFAVQKMLRNIKEKDDFENIFTELVEHTEDLLRIGYTGVVEALVAACLRMSTKQAQMFAALQSALHVVGSKEKSKTFFKCLLKLKPYEVLQQEQQSTFAHLHGSLMVQHILRYNKPILLVTCILETPVDELVSSFNTPNGSHIVDAFLESKFIGEKSREKLIRYLEGFYIDLAVTKHGSRAVESLYAAAQESQKVRIVKELAEKSNMLQGSPFGRLIFNKFRIKTYNLSAAQWRASLQQKENKVEELFKDIIK